MSGAARVGSADPAVVTDRGIVSLAMRSDIVTER